MEGSAGGSFRERDFEDFGDDLGVSQPGGSAARCEQKHSSFQSESGPVPYWRHGTLTHEVDRWERHGPEPEPAPLGPEPAPFARRTQFDLNQLHSSMERSTLEDVCAQHDSEMTETSKRHRSEQDGGCPALCVKYGSWPLGFLLGSLVVTVYVTGTAAHASVLSQAERDKATVLVERKRAYYERQAAETQAARPDDDAVDGLAVLFLGLSLFFGVYGIYAVCTRPKERTRHGLPTQEEVEEEARACRDQVITQVGAGDTDDDDMAALICAFEACDVDGSGQIDASEFHAILVAIGTSITRQEVEAIVEECEKSFANYARVSNVIRKVPLFAPLPEWQLRQIAESLRTIECEPGDVVIREGESGEAMFLIEEGELACTKDGIHGGKMLRKYSAGDFFGERALLVHEHRAATVTALTRCTLHKLTSASCHGEPNRTLWHAHSRISIVFAHRVCNCGSRFLTCQQDHQRKP